MARPPVVRVAVTPTCRHDDGWLDHGTPFEGRSLIVHSGGVLVDGKWVIRRDRRMKKNRTPGHNWLGGGTAWTGFDVDVETARKEA